MRLMRGLVCTVVACTAGGSCADAPGAADARSPDAPSLVACGTVVASGAAYAQSLISDETSLYWWEVVATPAPTARVEKVARTGGQPEPVFVTDRQVTALASNGRALYVLSLPNVGRKLDRVDAVIGNDGGHPVVTEPLVGFAVDDTGVYYIADRGDRDRIVHVDGAGASREMTSQVPALTSLAVDGEYVYFASEGGGIYRMPKAGGTVQPVRKTVFGVALQFDADYVYWDGGGQIYRAHKPTSDTWTGTENPVQAVCDFSALGPYAIFGSDVYRGADGALVRSPVTGPPETLLVPPAGTFDLDPPFAIDAAGIYYVDFADGTVRHAPLAGCVP